MTRVAEALNLVFHGIKTGERAELFADVEQWLQEMDDRSGARPPVTHTGCGRCIHNVPICGECQINHVLAHVADIEQVRAATGTPPTTPSDAAMRAAKELKSLGLLWNAEAAVELGGEPFDESAQVEQVALVITPHLAINASTPPVAPAVVATRITEELLREHWLLSDVTAEEFNKIAALITRHLAGASGKENPVSTVTFGDSKTIANPDVSCPRCGGTKPTCCSCPEPKQFSLPEFARELA